MAVVFFMATMVLYFTGTVFFLAYLMRRSEALSKVSLGVTARRFWDPYPCARDANDRSRSGAAAELS
ncbi:MAG: hypothetical protein KatS3mg082_0364 [Nitrospiraceae bacterium]|nr:MAG: hypothetical protein KatS3mg082_0364 [Nitrospiraceae bacterium]